MSTPKKPSYEAVHYLLRPAKNIQRKMLCQFFQRLDRFHPMEDYRYVGFGSVYFGDFVLFHRTLGITRMTTIEGNEEDSERFRFNAPFKCVEFLFGHSSKKLAEVAWEECPAIVWLDYDYALEESVLFDAMLTVRRAAPFSVFLVTLDAEQKELSKPFFGSSGAEIPDLPDGVVFGDLTPREQLAAKIQANNSAFLPEDVDLRGDGLADAYRQTLTNAIEHTLAERNAAHAENPRLKFVQFVNFRYADGREMMTWGGIIVPEDHVLAVAPATAELAALNFVRTGSDAFEIEAPKLTFKEIRELNAHMPAADPAKIPVPINEDDKRAFMKVYRYFPSFTEAEI